jgi:hypothetical protein
MKAIRFHVIRLAGRAVQHARRLIDRLARNYPSPEGCWRRVTELPNCRPCPSGRLEGPGKNLGMGVDRAG